MFQHVTKCTTHFLLRKRRQNLKKRQEYTGKVLQSLCMKQMSYDNLRRKGKISVRDAAVPKMQWTCVLPVYALVQMSMEGTGVGLWQTREPGVSSLRVELHGQGQDVTDSRQVSPMCSPASLFHSSSSMCVNNVKTQACFFSLVKKWKHF